MTTPTRFIAMRKKSRITLPFLLLLAGLAEAHAADQFAVWKQNSTPPGYNLNGFWSSAAQWTTSVPYFPNNGNGGYTWDAQLIDGVHVTLDQDVTVQKFILGKFDSGNENLDGAYTLTVNELLTWTSGKMSGAGVTNANGGVLFNSQNSDATLDTRTLNIPAGQIASQAGNADAVLNYPTVIPNRNAIDFANGAVINNNGTWAVTGAWNETGLLWTGEGGVGTFNNAGVFNVDTAADSKYRTVNVAFHNTGVVNVNSGMLWLGRDDNGGTMGDFNVASGATLRFGGNYTLTNAADVAGAGTVEFYTGTTTLAGTFTVPNLKVSGDGNAVFNTSALPTLASVSITGGSANFTTGSPVVTQTLAISGGGNLGGSDTVTSNGVITWASGKMSGSGVTNAKGGLLIDTVDQGVTLDTRTLNIPVSQTASQVRGTAIHGGDINFANGAVINNSGTWEVTGAWNEGGLLWTGQGDAGTFNNAGVFNVDTAADSKYRTVNVAFHNTGVVNVNSGELQLSGDGSGESGGIFNVAENAKLTFRDGSYTLSAGTLLAGSGSVAGNITNAGQIAPGNTSPALAFTDSLSLLSTSRLIFEIGGVTPGTGFDAITVAGGLTLGGDLQLSFSGGFQNTITSADTFQILMAGSLGGTFAGVLDGSRITTSDGLGTFAVNYTLTGVILSNFAAVPESREWALLGVGLAAIALARQRRARRRA